VDPGLGRLGYGVVAKLGMTLKPIAYGCIETSPELETSVRLNMLYDRLGEQIADCSPDFMCVEKLFFGRNITTAEIVWQARGVILLLAAQHRLPLVEPQPAQVKISVCGSGKADKRQVQRMVQRFLDLDDIPRPDDAADALALAITGFSFYK
jgi:crossover junction endodeoxyribonuclease RuvC